MLILIYTIFLPFGVYTLTCGGVHKEESGTISSSVTSRGQSCSQTIELSFFSTWVKLKFSKLEVDGAMPRCSKDRLEVWVGCLTEARKIATFCSNNMVTSVPHDIYSKERCVELRLHTSPVPSVKSSSGFTLVYQTGHGSAKISERCESYKDEIDSAGVIASPKWPEAYYKNDVPSGYIKDCLWDIFTARSNVIQINFMDIDFSNKMANGKECTNYANNHLKVKGDKSVSHMNRASERYCSLPAYSTYNTGYYNVEVTLKGYSTPSVSERGFVLGYLAYTREEDDDRSSQGLIIAGITLGVIITLVALSCYVRYRVKSIRAAHLQDEVLFRSGNGGESSAVITTGNQAGESLMIKDGSPVAVEIPPVQPYPGIIHYPGVQYPYEPPSYSTDAPPPYPGPPISENVVSPS